MAAKLSAAAKEARRLTRAKWREENKHKLAEYEANYWERKAREMGLAPQQENGDEQKQQA